MAHGHPDYLTSVIPSMPVAGEGQVPWYQSDVALVGATDSEDLINYVVPDDYELHVCSGVVSGDFPVHQRYALRTTPAATWVSPTGHSDPDAMWSDEEKAYDDDLDTLAYAGMPPLGWSSWLTLLVNEVYMDKVRFYVKVNPGIMDAIDIEAHYGGVWNAIYQGAFAAGEWVEKDIPAPAKLVSKARVRFHSAIPAIWNCALYEFQFNTAAVTPQEAIYFDTHAIIPYLPQAPYLVPAGATFVIRVYNDDDADHTMTVNIAGFLQKKV